MNRHLVIADLDWSVFSRVVAVANGKGGVGKTSVSTTIAAKVAKQGRKVLYIDMDPQANGEEDLGYEGDGGLSVLQAVLANLPVTVMRDVRPNLDVVASGEHLVALIDHLQSARLRRRDGDPDPLLLLAAALAPLLAGYDLVVVDCPPASAHTLQDAVLAFARYLLIPTKADKSSRKGLREMAQRFGQARALNPRLQLLGVVLFAISVRATTVEARARTWIAQMLAGNAPVFDATIRAGDRAAFDLRELGVTVHELADRFPALDADYDRLAVEALRRLVALEQAAAA